MKALRWTGDRDRYFGPFTYAHESDRAHATWEILLGSGDGEEYPGAFLRVRAFRRTLILALPAWVLRPHRTKVIPDWDEATVARLGRNYYWAYDEREFGMSYSDGFLQVFFGRNGINSPAEKRWSKFIPWKQFRQVRHSLYDRQGNHFADLDLSPGFLKTYDKRRALQKSCPSVVFNFLDYDGEAIEVTTRIEEREWHRGEGWFKWVSWFSRPKVSRFLDLHFSKETGRRKGSWKGGTIGHSIEMLPGELHASAFRRYCDEHDMKFMGEKLELDKEAFLNG